MHWGALEQKEATMKLETLLAVAAVSIAVMPAALAQETPSEKGGYLKSDVTRFVPSGKSRMLYHFTGVNPDCSVWNLNEMDFQLTKAPEHGTVEFMPGEAFATFTGANAHCSGKKYRGTTMRYKSSAGFTGLDEFEVFVMSPVGWGFEVHFKINVR
jgi:hypothetical protein